MKKTLLFLLVLITILLSSCTSNENIVATAIAETQTALASQVTPTITPIPTKTYTPTYEPLPTITSTPTLTPTETPIPSPTPDIRTIQVDAKTLLLTREELNYIGKDLPVKPYYYMPHSSWSGPHTNSEFIGFNGQEKGNSYVIDTGRIEGYYAGYTSDSLRSIAPKVIYMHLDRFESVEGAMKLKEYSFNDEIDFFIIERTFNLPEVENLKLLGYRETLSSGKYLAIYRISYIYRNFFVMVEGYDEQIETFTAKHFDFEYVETIAEVMLEKLKNAELTE